MTPKDTSLQMKDLEIISDPNTIKVLFDKTRAVLVFKYLVNEAMTVKQLADAIGKNPGNVLRHIDRLKDAGLVRQVRTEKTNTGIVQRYYRATAREYRLGITDMMKSGDGVRDYAEDRLRSIISSLSVYGVIIPSDKTEEAIELLRKLVERENTISAKVTIEDAEAWNLLPKQQQEDASRLMREAALTRDDQYQRLRQKWSEFVLDYSK
ncbi:MAG: winged helix-turn-helix domain-containing protein [Candidatus Thorarchaeota archaeon]